MVGTLGVIGASGRLYRLAMASFARSSPLAGGYPLDLQVIRTSFTASVTCSCVSRFPNTDGSPTKDEVREIFMSFKYRGRGR